MDKEKAKLILACSGPGESEKTNPEFAQALRMLEADPELAKWYRRERELDQAFREKFAEIQPPEGLKTRILHACDSNHFSLNSREGSHSRSSERGIFIPGKWVMPLAAAALVLILFTISGLRLFQGNPTPRNSQLTDSLAFLSERYVNQPGQSIQFDYESEVLGELQAYLAQQGAPYIKNPSGSISKMKPVGCLLVEYEDVELGLVCFRDRDQLLHVFSTDKAHFDTLFPGMKETALPANFINEGTQFRVWSEESDLYIMSHDGDKVDLDRFF